MCFFPTYCLILHKNLNLQLIYLLNNNKNNINKIKEGQEHK